MLRLEAWILEILESYGYFGVLLLIAIENIFPPIPSEVILTFSGFVTTKTNLTETGMVIYSTIGSVTGALALYGVGMVVDKNRIEKLIHKWGHIFRLTKEDVHKADQWFSKYGEWTIFFCRFIPLIRSLISIPAGMSHMNIGTFLILTTLGTLIWNFILIRLGATFGASWEEIVDFMNLYSNIAYASMAIILIVFAILFVRRKRSSK